MQKQKLNETMLRCFAMQKIETPTRGKQEKKEQAIKRGTVCDIGKVILYKCAYNSDKSKK